ncbi:MAG: hypothetical protein A2W26_01010 [Acidobacteria bacterium RBG_16_64_8]|nr:MAG: hypothetical protein A2W26_01010 [Acidobacteria bacterium RBG_16_64_8]
MRTVGLPAPSAAFPVEAFDAINERMSRRTGGTKSAWHAFASAWNAVVYRLTAAHQHADSLRLLLASPGASPEARYAEDHELLCWAVSAQSAVECGFCAVQVAALIADGKPFTPTKDAELRFSPRGVATDVAARWPASAIAGVLARRVAAPKLRQIEDLRRVLFHRGTLPRMIFLSVGTGRTTPDATPSNPADPADQWRYDLDVTPGMVDSKLVWCDDTIAELITALEAMTTGW